MRVTTWTEYSLIIALHLARRRSAGLGSIPARDLALEEHLPPDYVEQILLRLRRAGLVESIRGARGGYLLNRSPQEITVRDLMSASDRQTFEINCDCHPVSPERCAPGAGCAIRPVWQALKGRIDSLLGGISLADLMQDEATVRRLPVLSPA